MIYFKLPFSEKICTIDENSAEIPVSFFSFDGSQQINFQGSIQNLSQEIFSRSAVSSNDVSLNLSEFKPENQSHYEQKVEKVIQFVKENKLSKLVLSRLKLVKYEGLKIDFIQSFSNLGAQFPNAFVYFFMENGKCWMGAFSEVLGDFNKETSEFRTMSLAGTLPLNEDWTTKEIQEQRTVTDFILNTLKNFSTNIEQSGTSDHISGNIKHLRTDFTAKIKAEKLEELIGNLHPTPAVCGIPKDFCKKAILDFEKYPRDFYAGYIKVETSESIKYFVNLRCAEFFDNAALIHVGGGITAESSPEKEWEETELKADAILKNIVFV